MRIVLSAFVTLSLVLLVIAAAPYPAESGYWGEACWSLAVGSLPWLMKFGVEDIGGGHLLLVGKTNPFGVLVPVMGNAIVDTSNKIRISYTYWTPLCAGSSPSCAGTQIFESGGLVLDLSTLNGTVDFIDTKYSPTGFTQFHGNGTATFVTCPGPPW